MLCSHCVGQERSERPPVFHRRITRRSRTIALQQSPECFPQPRNEDEMREQLEQFAHCCMIAAQEAPKPTVRSNKALSNKMVSADDLAAQTAVWLCHPPDPPSKGSVRV